ncbi:MAG: hypothetical protein MUF69_14030 [Desulfobacterota bacterium]|nr:hypothetical protein [Thermodesulfobacteriota bacterium]
MFDEPIEPGQTWEVDLFRPEDAEGVARLFLQVYGKEYPIKTFVEPVLLIEENQARRTISIVARTPRGDIVGHNAIFNSAPFSGLYESGAGVVHPEYRGGAGIFARMNAHGLELGKNRFKIAGLFGESVCNHVFSQRMCARLGAVNMAVEMDLMPAAAYSQEGSARGRVSALLDYIHIQSKPQTVFIPQVYGEALNFIYGGLADGRTQRPSKDPIPADGVTELETQVFDFAQVARLAAKKAGQDFEQILADLERDLEARGVVVVQIWLNLAWPWVGAVVDCLRRRGYFLGGLLPRWFDSDGLLLQKTAARPGWEDMQVYFERAQKIAALARADWEDIKEKSR